MGGVGGEWVDGLVQSLGEWGDVMYVCCVYRLFVEMESPGICVLCSANTCAS